MNALDDFLDNRHDDFCAVNYPHRENHDCDFGCDLASVELAKLKDKLIDEIQQVNKLRAKLAGAREIIEAINELGYISDKNYWLSAYSSVWLEKYSEETK